MNKFIAFCGLNCETCEARLATVSDDDEMRSKVAKEWSELNNAEITVMNEVNRTLFIPLYGKARVSRQHIILDDPTVEENRFI